jgi:hypothetical protein
MESGIREHEYPTGCAVIQPWLAGNSLRTAIGAIEIICCDPYLMMPPTARDPLASTLISSTDLETNESKVSEM